MQLNKVFVVAENILVFRSNIDDSYKAAIVCAELEKMDGVYRVNVDLDDWENILRLQCDPQIDEHRIQQAVSALGFECYEL
jgi:hypothetical protein